MSIYSSFDAFKHLKIGRRIGYYIGDPIYNKIADGTITDIEPCDSRSHTCKPCQVMIGIDNELPDCFRWNDLCGIRYVLTNDFIKEDEFIL